MATEERPPHRSGIATIAEVGASPCQARDHQSAVDSERPDHGRADNGKYPSPQRRCGPRVSHPAIPAELPARMEAALKASIALLQLHAPKTLGSGYSGYSLFRPYQRETIQKVLDGRDCLVVMATGSGKSIW
ncbi:hypothetical protein C2845_PM03G16490 [Panicum miliaceum]|uniref:Uncharacterized protein n=1 Tax=Panicum miliaceum TaxID=4540 RepID=A0A3L6T621_PANMI|nr:hypothetical protein C2845_PM03G16490 [Panicum miliaceum]